VFAVVVLLRLGKHRPPEWYPLVDGTSTLYASDTINPESLSCLCFAWYCCTEYCGETGDGTVARIAFCGLDWVVVSLVYTILSLSDTHLVSYTTRDYNTYTKEEVNDMLFVVDSLERLSLSRSL
jgi:hypothetical protein